MSKSAADGAMNERSRAFAVKGHYRPRIRSLRFWVDDNLFRAGLPVTNNRLLLAESRALKRPQTRIT